MKLQLFHKNACPYSAKVRSFIDEAHLRDQIEFHEIIEEPGAADQLEEMTGKHQVPCLVRDGEPLLESDEIINELRRLSPRDEESSSVH